MTTRSIDERWEPPFQHLLEEGQAVRRLTADGRLPPPDRQTAARERFDVVVIGAGQAGLSVGYHLARRGLRFVILDAHARVGDAWRRRWDSLRLFTPAWLDRLDGMPFPAPRSYFPTKDEMADYLESYAARFRLPVRTGVRVETLTREDGVYVVRAAGVELEAAQVVVAMASYQRPRLPAFARELRPDLVQLAASDYKSPGQLRDGATLVVGAGNSGAEIALDVARGRKVLLAGRKVGQVPFDIHGLPARLFLGWLVMRVVFHRILTVRTPMGRRARPGLLSKGGPLVRQKEAHLRAAGIERVPRLVSARGGLPLLDDGRVLDVQNIIWSTGYQADLSWIDLPVFDESGAPRHDAGVVTESPGLYFVGLPFLYSYSSTMIHGVRRDAARIAKAAAARARGARR
jgi:putative flavoprotein involved in K+ transport